MADDTGVPVGQEGAPFTLPVERGKVREFARATKSRNDAYRTPDAVTPATFLQTMSFWMEPDSNPWRGITRDFRRILHGEQEFVFHGPPPRAGDVLTGTSRIDSAYEKDGKRGGTMKFIDTVTEFRAPDGRLVAESRSTTIETSRAVTDG